MDRPNRRTARGILALITGALLAMTLSGCFMVSVLDGRSPFDDPFGASYADISAGIPVLQQALDGIETGPDWELVAGRASDNCEGACLLRLRAQIKPSSTFAAAEADLLLTEGSFTKERTQYVDVDVPTEVWKKTSRVAISTAEQLGLNVTVEGEYADTVEIQDHRVLIAPRECAAVREAFGVPGDVRPTSDPQSRFRVSTAMQDTSCSVLFFFSEHADLAEGRGL